MQKTVFSSNDLPQHLDEKAKFGPWQDIHVAQIWSVEYGISENLPFEAAIEATPLGPLVLGHMAGTIKHATRKASNIADDSNDGYLLLINEADTPLTGVQFWMPIDTRPRGARGIAVSRQQTLRAVASGSRCYQLAPQRTSTSNPVPMPGTPSSVSAPDAARVFPSVMGRITMGYFDLGPQG